MRRLLVIPLALLVLVTAGCEGEGGRPETATPASAPSLSDDAARESAPDATDRKEIVTGFLQLTAADPVATGGRVREIVGNADGRIDSVTESPEVSSTLTTRVPAGKLDEVVDEIRTLGRVTNLTTSRDDVTMQYTDLEARAGALRASVDRLRGLIDSAGNVADLLAAENALSQRQAELDGLEAQRRQMADMIDLSTLTVDITTDRLPSEEDSFWDGLLSGWSSLWSTLGAAVVGIGAAIPWVAFLVVCAGVLYLIIRLFTRKERSSGTAGRSPTERTENDA